MTSPEAHLLPFSVDLEGPVQSQNYFQYGPSTTASNENNMPTYETILLGRKLVGYKVQLPDTCRGNDGKISQQKEAERGLKSKKVNCGNTIKKKQS